MPRILSGKVIFYLLLLAILDSSLRPMIRIGDAGPMFLYLMTPYAVFQWGFSRSLALAALIGIFRDLTGPHRMGIEVVTLLLFTFLFDLLAQKVERNSNWVRFAGAFLFVFCVLAATAVFSRFLGDRVFVSGYMLGAALGTAFYTACLTPGFFALTARWFHDRVPMKQYELFG